MCRVGRSNRFTRHFRESIASKSELASVTIYDRYICRCFAIVTTLRNKMLQCSLGINSMLSNALFARFAFYWERNATSLRPSIVIKESVKIISMGLWRRNLNLLQLCRPLRPTTSTRPQSARHCEIIRHEILACYQIGPPDIPLHWQFTPDEKKHEKVLIAGHQYGRLAENSARNYSSCACASHPNKVYKDHFREPMASKSELIATKLHRLCFSTIIIAIVPRSLRNNML